MEIQPITLSGRFARLEPLAAWHAEGLYEAGREPSIWTWLTRGPFESLDDARVWVDRAMQDSRGGKEMPFAIIDARSGKAVGSTRFLDIRPASLGVEIGWTWLTPAAQRTAINTECKFMLLSHAFDTWGCGRVQLKTDLRNLRSQAAIERIGGVREGVLRKHMLTQNGHIRDTVMYSILAEEWPGVRERLKVRLT